MKRFDQPALTMARLQCDPAGDEVLEPWPGFKPGTLPHAEWPLAQVPAVVHQTVSVVIREAIEAGLSLHETCDHVVDVLARNNLSVSCDELHGWVGAHALSVT